MAPPRIRRRRIEWDDDSGDMLRWMLTQTLVRAVPVEVGDILVEHPACVALVVDQHAVGALVADGAHEPLDIAVRLWRLRWDLHYLDVLVGEDGVELAGVLAIPVPDQ